ncbi:hypothetical protein C1H46_030336 [Malus baccata]|uniref:Uncharacterized protein n=1 Tax=Malus baccata TaxID=106549 RepID=A0A540LCA8_MALBA|nr:hypothetical protein C1H46_030336 [Malus baccata]
MIKAALWFCLKGNKYSKALAIEKKSNKEIKKREWRDSGQTKKIERIKIRKEENKKIKEREGNILRIEWTDQQKEGRKRAEKLERRQRGRNESRGSAESKRIAEKQEEEK